MYTPDISLLLYGFVRQEIVHHTRTHSGRIKGNESPSLFLSYLCLSLSLDTPALIDVLLIMLLALSLLSLAELCIKVLSRRYLRALISIRYVIQRSNHEISSNMSVCGYPLTFLFHKSIFSKFDDTELQKLHGDINITL